MKNAQGVQGFHRGKGKAFSRIFFHLSVLKFEKNDRRPLHISLDDEEQYGVQDFPALICFTLEWKIFQGLKDH